MKRALPLTPLLLLCALGAWSATAQGTCLRDSTSPQDWEQAARHVAGSIKAHPEASPRVLIWPPWRETPLPELVEVSQTLLWQQRPLLEDLQRTSEVFVIAPRDRLDEALDALPFAPVEAPEWRSFGSVVTTRLALPASTQWPAPSLLELLDEASLSVVSSSEATKALDCTRHRRAAPASSGWRCPKVDTSIVAGEYELDDQPHRCLIAHPPQDPNFALRIKFPALLPSPADGGATLRLRAGNDLRGARLAKVNHPIVLRALRGERVIARAEFMAFESTWEAIDIDLPESELPLDDLTLEVSSPRGEAMRFCVNGWLIPR